MPRTRPDFVPSYRRHKPTGQGVVTLNGKDHYLGRYGTVASKAEYDRLISEWLAGGRQLPNAGSMTVVELCRAYWNAMGKQLTGGRADNLKAVIGIVRKAYGMAHVPEFGPKSLKLVREKMRELGWSRVYVNRQVAWIKRMFRWGAEEELVGGDQVHALWSVAGIRRGVDGFRETEPIKPVDVETVEATLPYLPPAMATMVRVQLLSGCRPAEICKLDLARLDMSRPDLWTYQPHEHKGAHLGRERFIYFGPQAVELIRPWLRADGKPLFSPAESEERRCQARRQGRKSPMTPSQSRRKRTKHRARPRGDIYTTTDYRNGIYRACDKAWPLPEHLGQRTLETGQREGRIGWWQRLTAEEKEAVRSWRREHRWHPNQLRHTRATEVCSKFGLEAAQVFWSHAKADVTQVYAERDQRLGEEVARKIG
jgi:integrase